jgi:hypothetical protein
MKNKKIITGALILGLGAIAFSFFNKRRKQNIQDKEYKRIEDQQKKEVETYLNN